MRYLIIAAILLASCSNEPSPPITGVVIGKTEKKEYYVEVKQETWPYYNTRSISEDDYNKIVIGQQITINQGKVSRGEVE